jgi:Family of unknown function (DUF6159)
MDRISRGLRLLKASWNVLMQDRELLVLPLISLLAIVVAALGIGGLGWASGALDTNGHTSGPLVYVLAFGFYFVTYFISIYFSAAVIAAASIRLSGGDPTLGDGLRAANGKLGKIAGWAAVAATVGLILRALEERFGFVGRIVIGIIGVAWSAVTFFVVPVLLFEPVGVVDGIKRSGSLFKQRWGEQFTGSAGIGLGMFLIAIPVAAVVVLLFAASPVLGVVAAVLAFGALTAVGGALTGVFNAALYRYATTGEAGGVFSADDLNGSFHPRRSRGAFFNPN